MIDVVKRDFVDSRGELKMTLLFDEGRVSQVRLYLQSLDPSVYDKMLIYSDKHFKDRITLFYNKRFIRNNRHVTEYYINGQLTDYSEEYLEGNATITKCFDRNGIEFSHNVTLKDNYGNEILRHLKIENADGSILEDIYWVN